MKFVISISGPQGITPDELISILPEDFSLQEEDGQLQLLVEPGRGSSYRQVSDRVQQECDRIFFITGDQLSPELVRIENTDGTGIGWSTLPAYLYAVEPLPPKIDRQQWQTTLPVQLCLWRIAHRSDVPIATKINLLFQIIEIAYPDTRSIQHYPASNDPSTLPHARTEAKLLRDLASHGKKQMGNQQIINYCQHHGIPAESHDPTDRNFNRFLQERLEVVENEARQIIEDQLTRKP